MKTRILILVFGLLGVLGIGTPHAQVSKFATQASIDSLLPSAMNIRISEIRKAFAKALNYADPTNFPTGAVPLTKLAQSGATLNQVIKWNGTAWTVGDDAFGVAGSSSWGGVTGTLSNQTDLQAALNLKAPLANPTFTGTVGGITKAMVGLSNVDNTADASKPISSATQAALDAKAPLANPTFTGTVAGITKTMVGLGNVDNTADASKPISSATQAALDAKAPLANPTFTGTVGGITKAMVGLGNADNTSDANKPISTATQTALNGKASTSHTHIQSEVGLGNVDNTSDANKPISSATQAALNGKAPINNPTFTGTVAGVTKGMIGLGNADNTADADKPISNATQSALNGKANTSHTHIKSEVGLTNVDNTSDANKPISTATQTALDLKSPINNPTFTGTVNGVTKTMVGLANADNTSDANKPISTAQQTAFNSRVLAIDNVATLKTVTGVAGQIVKTKGYYTDADGGGNSYQWNTTSTATDDGGSVIQVTAVSTGRWIAINEAPEINVKTFGAKGDNIADDTTPLGKAFVYSVANSKVLLITQGEYKVSSYLLNNTNYSGTECLNVRILGNVKITAATGATAIAYPLITFGHNTKTNVSITGDILTVDLNQKFTGFLDVKNYGIVAGSLYKNIDGDANISPSSLNIYNAYAINAGDVTAIGLIVIGSFKHVRIENVTIKNVTRAIVGTGDCKGIAVAHLRGEALINHCTVSNVLANAAYFVNADGISVFGVKADSTIENSFRTGKVVISNCKLSDNQGRNIKIQVSESVVEHCTFERQFVIGIDNSHDIDLQFGNGKVVNNTFVYKKNGATSPLGTYFAAVKFQEVLPNREQFSIASNNTFYTEAVIPYVFFLTHGNSLSPTTVASSTVEIENNHVINTGAFVGTGAIQRGFCEFNADEVDKVVGKAEINLRNNSFFSSATSALLSYNNAIYNIKDQLVFRVENNRNTNSAILTKVFHNYWGGQIDSVDNYKVWGNSGFDEVIRTTWKLNLSKGKVLAPTQISMDLFYHANITNKPPTLGTTGNAIITFLGDWPTGLAKVEIYENTGGATDYIHRTTPSGTWKKVAVE